MAASIQNGILATEVFHLSDSVENKRLIAKVANHYLNCEITILLPGKAPVLRETLECLAEQMSYMLKDLPLYRFLEMPFINAFVKQGNIYAISQNTRLLCHDSVAVIPPGWLILHLTKDTYQELGLEAAKRTHLDKENDVYVVKINLLADSFKPGCKHYDRVLWCLKDRLDLIFNFLIAWVPKDPNICNSSVAVYFSDLCEGVGKVECEKSSKVVTSLPAPHISVNQPEGSDTGCTHQEVFEWMGALACDIDVRRREEDSETYVSTFFCPEPCYNIPQCNVFKASGFFTPETISKILQSLRQHASSQTDSLPAMLTVHGCENNPLARRMAGREFHTPGDNVYSVLLLPDQMCWFITSS